MAWETVAPPRFQFTSEHKKKFAVELLRTPNDAFKAAVAVFGAAKDMVGRCAQVTAEWPNDPEVLQFQREALEVNGGSEAFLPTKEAAAFRVWSWTETGDLQSRIKAMQLLAEMQGWISKDKDPLGSLTIPPSIHYEIGLDHDKPPAAEDNSTQ